MHQLCGDKILSDYKIISEIGCGAFGKVYKITLNSSSENFAMKRVIQDEKYQNRELDIIKMLKHPNIIEINYYFYDTYVFVKIRFLRIFERFLKHNFKN